MPKKFAPTNTSFTLCMYTKQLEKKLQGATSTRKCNLGGSTRGNSRKIHCGDWAKRFFLIQKKKSLKAMKTTKTMKRNELIDM
ncbi:uncharacterized protein [Phaseolus vulgaris]|uniref:uncharacterized protein isoform X4 n=1 Tax=Phaseolus vulgaris TaxID=3885 RepID=UPI0035CB55AB